MKCRKCGERLKVTRTKSKAGRVTVRYYSCPGCGTRCSSTERLADKESTVDTPPGSVQGAKRESTVDTTKDQKKEDKKCQKGTSLR